MAGSGCSLVTVDLMDDGLFRKEAGLGVSSNRKQEVR